MSGQSKDQIASPRMIAWEITRGCNLRCVHCRASAEESLYEGELSTEEGYHLIDDIAQLGRPAIILTGGEPLKRSDIFELASYASERGFPVSVGTNGTLITKEIVEKLKQVPISRISVSLDFPSPELQDRFRGMEGAFDKAVQGIKKAQSAGLEVQINCTITKMNMPYIESLVSLACDLGAVSFHPFMIVPTGRGKGLKEGALTAEESERILRWIVQKEQELADKITFRPTCAPFYQRIVEQKPAESASGGCLAGVSFCFISHVGQVQGCGYLDVAAGNIRQSSFSEIWRNSHLFAQLRDPSQIKGKCRDCEYRETCGGCRARAYEATGDYLESEPYCAYQPKIAQGCSTASKDHYGGRCA